MLISLRPLKGAANKLRIPAGAAILWLVAAFPAAAQDYSDCLDCHGDKYLETRAGRSAYVDKGMLQASAHGAVSLSCVDCHDSLKGGGSGPHVHPLPPARCAGCHEPEIASYEASFHGKAARFGKPDAPRCASCHGIHDVKLSADPASRTHPANLVKTCRSCHRGASAGVTRGKIHVLSARRDSPGTFVVRIFYTIAIVGFMAACLLHIGADLFRRGRKRRRP